MSEAIGVLAGYMVITGRLPFSHGAPERKESRVKGRRVTRARDQANAKINQELERLRDPKDIT